MCRGYTACTNQQNRGPSGGRWRCLDYFLRRAQLNLAMIEQLDLAGRTGEMARTFGIDFFSVLTRGSQYRVESMLLRIAHSQNYLLPSPSRDQVGPRASLKCLIRIHLLSSPSPEIRWVHVCLQIAISLYNCCHVPRAIRWVHVSFRSAHIHGYA